MSTETKNWKVTPGVGHARPRTVTVRHWETDHTLTLNPEGVNLAAVFENGRRLGYIETRVKPGTVSKKQFRHTIPGAFTPGHWTGTRARAIETLLFAVKNPGELARRQAARDAAEAADPQGIRRRLRGARDGLDAAEQARTLAVIERRSAVAQALALGMARADIADTLGVTRQMVDRIAE